MYSGEGGERAKKFHEFISRRLRENWKVNF